MTEQRKQKQRIGLLGPHSVNSLTTNNFKIWTRSEEERKELLLWPSGDSEVNGNTSALLLGDSTKLFSQWWLLFTKLADRKMRKITFIQWKNKLKTILYRINFKFGFPPYLLCLKSTVSEQLHLFSRKSFQGFNGQEPKFWTVKILTL